MSFEESLVRHASPTLAGIKVANLYNCRFPSPEEGRNTIAYFNEMLNEKGIYIELLQSRGDFYLIYVYRKSQLLELLKSKEIRNFLAEYGFPKDGDLDACLALLKEKLKAEKAFPHEVGVFLGYPLEDVRCFIATKGQQCTVCGEWKAYQNAETAMGTFCRYQHCKDIYIKVYGQGRKFSQMLVSA